MRKTKITKFILFILMLMGIAWSISNYFAIELSAVSLRGVLVNGVCMGKGDVCDITAFSTE